MNHGKIENQEHSRLVERMNQAIGRLLGKKAKYVHLSQPKIPSNNRFLLILLFMLILLWLVTGIYYVPEGSYGLILIDGKISRVVKGIQVGFARPYPFLDVVNFDAGVSNFSIGKADQIYAINSKDRQHLAVISEIGYYISNPQLYYTKFYQENADLDLAVANIIKVQLQSYFIQESSTQLLQASNIVMANEIRDQSQIVLNQYGLALDKLTLISVRNILPTNSLLNVSESVAAPNLALQIIQMAQNYQIHTAQLTESVVVQFKQLLPQYQANPTAITQLMYYKMLNSIPLESAVGDFTLLNLAESQFLALASISSPNVGERSGSVMPEKRVLDRTVDRQRILYKGP